ncbi:MAG: 1,4-dihydroxy-2-naphthoate octaprenyltransferase [Chlamydiae bacterium]|jgi:1,4-dihydroxy-2-naphthoate octaprenyltransferase|nr:1,4-dihydroxy-2-naphthoate octaprenyltransferase [Chlamydiota bacterium]
MKLSLWLEASRPKTLIASISPVLIGSAISLSFKSFSFLILLNSLLTAIFLQIGTNLANDYFDSKKGSDRETRIGPRRIMQKGLVREDAMKRAIFISFLIAASSCIFLISKGGPLISYLLVLAVLLGIGYTAGPFALAYIGLGDVVVFFFFGCVATLMTAYLQTGKFLIEAFIGGIAPGALSTAILTANNLRDRIEDEKANKKTLIVRFGDKFGKWEYTFFVILAFFIPFFMKNVFHFNSLILLTFFPSLYALLLIRDVWQAKTFQDYLPLLPKTSLLLTLYTILFCLGLLR